MDRKRYLYTLVALKQTSELNKAAGHADTWYKTKKAKGADRTEALRYKYV